MPIIRTDAEVDIDIYDFLDHLSKRETQALINELKTADMWNETVSENGSLIDIEWNKTFNVLSKNRRQLTVEEEELIKKIANRF